MSDQTFTGRPFDIDFLGDHTQVLLTADPSNELVSITTSNALQDLLQIALMQRAQVTVSHTGTQPAPTLTGVAMTVNGSMEKGQVRAIRCGSSPDKKSPDRCVAEIFTGTGPDIVTVMTSEPLALGVLLTAIAKSLPLQELEFDQATHEITRVKVNVA